MLKRLKQGFKKFFSHISKDEIKIPLTMLKIQEKHLKVDELKLLLLKNDVAYNVTEDIIEKLKEKLIGKEVKRHELKCAIKTELEKIIKSFFVKNSIDLLHIRKKPFVILFLGFNGSGKTTTIAKIAYYLRRNKKSVVIAAGDTFRAAGIEQIEKHAEKLNVRVVKHRYGADPAAVIYDAIQYATKHNIDFVLCDTAGRTHSNINLMDELKKISRVNKPDLKVLVLDSLTGNDVVQQVESFNKHIGIDAMIFTKTDVYEKGAIISAVATARKPILFLGTGQDYKDLKTFDMNIIKSIF